MVLGTQLSALLLFHKPYLQKGNISNYIRNTSCNERNKYLDIPHIPYTILKLYGTILAKLCNL
jgi:hypothetical protein